METLPASPVINKRIDNFENVCSVYAELFLSLPPLPAASQPGDSEIFFPNLRCRNRARADPYSKKHRFVGRTSQKFRLLTPMSTYYTDNATTTPTRNHNRIGVTHRKSRRRVLTNMHLQRIFRLLFGLCHSVWSS